MNALGITDRTFKSKLNNMRGSEKRPEYNPRAGVELELKTILAEIPAGGITSTELREAFPNMHPSTFFRRIKVLKDQSKTRAVPANNFTMYCKVV